MKRAPAVPELLVCRKRLQRARASLAAECVRLARRDQGIAAKREPRCPIGSLERKETGTLSGEHHDDRYATDFVIRFLSTLLCAAGCINSVLG